jgi:hypothetical protein
MTWIPARSFWQRKTRHPKRQFSVKAGTLFEESPIPLGKWLIVAWMLGNGNDRQTAQVCRTDRVGIKAQTILISGYGVSFSHGEEQQRFGDLMKRVIKVSPEELRKRIKEQKAAKRPAASGSTKTNERTTNQGK